MNPFSELAKQMEERGAKLNPYDMEEATVVSVKPLSIRIGQVNISHNLYLSSGLFMEEWEDVESEEAALHTSLKSLYMAFQIQVGDRVLVKRIGNAFYILAKVKSDETI